MIVNPQRLTMPARHRNTAAGFTLVELMVTLVVLAVIVGAVAAIVVHVGRSSDRTSHRAETVQTARAAMDLIVRDVRIAGYDTDLDAATPQPAIAYVDSAEIILCENQQPYPDTTSAGPQVPQAYNPAGSPKPAKLTATAWTPPQKYTTGAELVRYTLDVNNDGRVDADDISSAQGADAASTPNPDDYVLVREVYGDYTGNTAGNNGGAQEQVALVRKPGNGVPPIFTVYMKGSSTPWDWANGPVPASQLQQIQRVEVRVTAPATKPESDGTFAQTTLTTQVNSMRSVPDFGLTTYNVSGYVFDDKNLNGVMDGLDTGLGGVTVRLGNYVGYTASSGYYSIRAANGTYTLRHSPPSGYGVFTSPDSFRVTVASTAVSRSFADTSRQGGWVTMSAWNDENQNQVKDASEAWLSGIKFTQQASGDVAYTDVGGQARLFAQVGGFSIATSVPDSMIATTPSTYSATMTNGGTASASVGLKVSANGFIRGQVFRDNNRNGVPDGTDAGLSNVWVGATTDGGLTIQGYVYTDASGNFTLTVPANDPPHTNPYSVFIVPPAGFFPTNSTTIGNLWVQQNATLTGKNFGMASYQIITLNASRVLSLASRDLIEKDWNGNQTQNARQDADLVLGADAGGTDNVSVWFNNYASTPLFNPSASYSRLAPNSVMAMALDTLDKNAPVARPDLVTGTKIAANGNFFVWLNQGSNNNEGYFPTTYSTGMNYRTNDGGDVQAVLTYDCAGGAMPDIIVGTRSLTWGQGTVEVWQSNDATTPTFTRQEIYPPAGSIGGGRMGEVTCMALADFDNDGLKDLVVGTKTGDASGEVMFFKYVSKTNGNRFVWRYTQSISSGYVTCLGVDDVDGDGQRDVVVGTHLTASSGKLIWLRNRTNMSTMTFANQREIDAPGVVMSLSVADMGGTSSTSDLIVGWRSSDNAYGGGVTVYYLDLLTLPSAGVDPSNGAILNMVPASTVANFNYGLNTTAPPTPYLSDFAVGVKSSATTGAVVVFIR
jgi:prepilin-type N-terminal cleavage/methylation domain-containing protein